MTLGWEDCCGESGGGPACLYIRGGRHPRNRYIRRTKFGRSVSLATEVPPFRHPHDLNFILVFFPISFLISVIRNKQIKTHGKCFPHLWSSVARNACVTFWFPAPFPAYSPYTPPFFSRVCVFSLSPFGEKGWRTRHCVFFFFLLTNLTKEG